MRTEADATSLRGGLQSLRGGLSQLTAVRSLRPFIQNGVVSLWACANSNVLQYTLSATYSLLPSPPRTLAGATMQIMSLKAARWRRPCAHGEQVEDGSTPEQPPSVGVTPPKRLLACPALGSQLYV